MPHRIVDLTLRGILDSRGGIAAEAELRVEDGSTGTASTPLAIARGRREHRRTDGLCLGPLPAAFANGAAQALRARAFEDQRDFDETLAELDGALGSDLTAALSLAFARACAQSAGMPLVRYVADLVDRAPAMPHPLVNVFSGGVHLHEPRLPFQQIMLVPALGSIAEDVEAAREIYAAVEAALERAGVRFAYSASSGLVPERLGYRDVLGVARDAIESSTASGGVALGVDVAAEHLRTPDGRYRVGPRELGGDELAEELLDLVRTYGLAYVEDPFDPDDAALWQAFTRAVPATACVVGDDLFASDPRFVAPGLAHGILLKLSQSGTLTRALDAARAAAAHGMALCVSHRSGETEDTGLCDLAVGIGARYAKIGGPRRGDRVAKYNQLLRLAETMVPVG
jgi:enolase